MLTSYIQAALRRAHYEILSDDSSFYGEIPGFEGVLANAPTLEACRRDLLRYLKQLGFEGPISGGKHEFVLKGTLVVTIPNPHGSDIEKSCLGNFCARPEVDRKEWEKL